METDKSIIPEGPYCYTPKKLEWTEGGVIMTIDLCFYFKYNDEDSLLGTCKMLNCEILDQCKICGINDEIGDEE